MKEVIKKHPKTSGGITVVLVALISQFETISIQGQEWYRLLFPLKPANSEFIQEWEKPESNVPDYVQHKDKTLFNIKAEGTK